MSKDNLSPICEFSEYPVAPVDFDFDQDITVLPPGPIDSTWMTRYYGRPSRRMLRMKRKKRRGWA
jgi:hypothetical protein